MPSFFTIPDFEVWEVQRSGQVQLRVTTDWTLPFHASDLLKFHADRSVGLFISSDDIRLLLPAPRHFAVDVMPQLERLSRGGLGLHVAEMHPVPEHCRHWLASGAGPHPPNLAELAALAAAVADAG